MFPDDIYLGDECPINLEMKYDSKFVCVYDLADYPFDTQRCHLALVMATASADFVVMERNLINFVGEKKLLEYQITSILYKDVLYQNSSGIQIILEFTNMYTYYITSTYVPTWLLIIISYLTFWFPLDDFNDRIMVSLTSLLVLASLFAQTSSGLPRTSYLKLIDIWFVACIMMDFLMVACLVIINRRQTKISVISSKPVSKNSFLRKKIKWPTYWNQEELNIFSRILFLATTLLLTIIYVGYVIYVKQVGFRGIHIVL